MTNFENLEQAMRTWVLDAVKYLSHTQPFLAPSLARWQRDSDGLFRNRDRPLRFGTRARLMPFASYPAGMQS
jgi:hypothetical protein